MVPVSQYENIQHTNNTVKLSSWVVGKGGGGGPCFPLNCVK